MHVFSYTWNHPYPNAGTTSKTAQVLALDEFLDRAKRDIPVCVVFKMGQCLTGLIVEYTLGLGRIGKECKKQNTLLGVLGQTVFYF